VDGNETPEQSADGYWLMRGGTVLAAAEVATKLGERSKGLLGRSHFDGALVLRHTRGVHSMGMRFPIDVAFLDRDLVVVDLTHLPPWRMTIPRMRARSVLEASAGAFERWDLRVGDKLELRCGR